MDEFKAGQKVYWRDPEDETSGVYEVYKKYDEYTYLIGNGGSETEVYAGEIFDLSQKVLFRKWAVSGTFIALFPKQELDDNPSIVASYQSGVMKRDAEYDFVMEATIPAYKSEYQELLKELKEDGYDALEVISEPPLNLYKLLGTMDGIAHKLITSIYITDFTTSDRVVIAESNAKRPFIWQIRDTGTWLYFTDEADWKKRVADRISFFKNSRIENLYYLFDGEEFYPVFEKIILEMIKE